MSSESIVGGSKVIGYFSYTPDGQVCCDGDACVIASSEQQMKAYLQQLPKGSGKDIIRKTRFGDIVAGLEKGGAYAFDDEAYARFLTQARRAGITGLPENEYSAADSPTSMHFIRIQSMG